SATPKVLIKDAQVYPDVNNKTAKVLINVSNNTIANTAINIAISAKAFNTRLNHQVTAVSKQFNITTGDTVLEMILSMTNKVLLWSEFDPALYKLTVSLSAVKSSQSKKELSFGMRAFKAEGTQFTINGQKTFLRGTVNNCEFPL